MVLNSIVFVWQIYVSLITFFKRYFCKRYNHQALANMWVSQFPDIWRIAPFWVDGATWSWRYCLLTDNVA